MPVAAVLLFLAVASAGQTEPPVRESHLTVYGDDPCPEAADDEEIVVCARRPEEERYRIPAPLRQTEPIEMSWGSRVAELDELSRETRPNGCSVVGSYGQTGCTQALIRRWSAERRSRRTR